jgi:hypothetical protein
MPVEQQFNVNWESWECIDRIYEILDFLSDIRLALLLGLDLAPILNPPFDPFKTVGKY